MIRDCTSCYNPYFIVNGLYKINALKYALKDIEFKSS
jgi:hypothetical protein